MIEKFFIKDQLNLKRWRHFKSRKTAFASLIILCTGIFFSFTAEFWANEKPWILKYNHNFYFPILFHYHPQNLKIKDAIVINYKTLPLQKEKGDFALWPPLNWGHNESNKLISTYPGPPTPINLMGTDDRGRDVLTRLLYGLRYSLIYSVSVWAITFIIAIILGGAMGYFGGKIDFYGQRAVEVLSTVPTFFLLLIIVSIFEPNLSWLILISATFGWIPMSYYVRGEFLKNRAREYVEAARALGAPHTKIIFHHILPNSLIPLMTLAPFEISQHIVGLTSLDFLGFGLMPPTPSWGELLNQAKSHFTTAWWLAFFPSLALLGTLVLLTLIGEGIRDAIDPHS